MANGGWQPRIAEVRAEATRWQARLEVPEALDCWPGHFPDMPIVPGVLQLDWVIELARAWKSPVGEPDGVSALKFRRVLRPGERCDVLLEWPEGGPLHFALNGPDGPVSSGRVSWGRP